MNLIINKIFNSITYILPIGSEKECYLVDCGDIDKIVDEGWIVRGVLLTHAHFDHIYGLNKLVYTFPNVIIYTNQAGKEGLQNEKWNFSKYHTEVENFIFSRMENVRILEEGILELDEGFIVNILYTPGHDPSCISYIVGNYLFTGDAYLPGLNVFTKFPRGNKLQAQASREMLMKLEKQGYKIYCGHHSY